VRTERNDLLPSFPVEMPMMIDELDELDGLFLEQSVAELPPQSGLADRIDDLRRSGCCECVDLMRTSSRILIIHQQARSVSIWSYSLHRRRWARSTDCSDPVSAQSYELASES